MIVFSQSNIGCGQNYQTFSPKYNLYLEIWLWTFTSDKGFRQEIDTEMEKCSETCDLACLTLFD